jgi:phosphosulfolactate synthase
VLSEVGSKDDTGAITPPYQWVEQMRSELEAGAWKVIAEGREAGTAGIFRPTGEVREGLIGEIVHVIDPATIMFDAPSKHQQVWFLQRFGSEVNLSNIATGDVLAVETLRLGLRSDTLGIGR